MENLHIPEGAQAIMPYLIVKNAKGFIQFMQEVFGATEKYKVMRDEQLIMHAELTYHGSLIMLADSTDQISPDNAGLFIYVSNADEIFKKAIDAGATSIKELSDENYGRSGGVRDPFGNVWWITCLQ